MGVRNFCRPVLLFYGSNYIEFKSKSKIFRTLCLSQNFLLDFSSSFLFSFWFNVLIKKKWKNGFCKSLRQFTSYFFRSRCYSASKYTFIIPSSSQYTYIQCRNMYDKLFLAYDLLHLLRVGIKWICPWYKQAIPLFVVSKAYNSTTLHSQLKLFWLDNHKDVTTTTKL